MKIKGSEFAVNQYICSMNWTNINIYLITIKVQTLNQI